MAILKLKAACKDYLWGGSKLKTQYNKEYDGDVLAESWELSCHPAGPSIIENGTYKGEQLQTYIEKEGKKVLGNNCGRFEEFPILIKFIDANKDLSIQVHPDNEYALKHENQYGKTEMWYIMDCAEDAFIYYGLKKDVSKEEFAGRIKDNTLTEILNKVQVKKGDVFFIEAGTIHAIGKNILVAEIQQSSNVTYRVYDYGRKDANGETRELHIDKAIEVTNLHKMENGISKVPHIASCNYFTVDKLYLNGKNINFAEGTVNKDSFLSVLVLDGEGIIEDSECKIDYKKGDSFFISADTGRYSIAGYGEFLMTYLEQK